MTSLIRLPFPGVLQLCGKFFFRYRNALFPAIFIVAAIFPAPERFASNPNLDRLAVSLGIFIALAGDLVRALTIGLVYIHRGGKDGRAYAPELVCEGIYSHSRNPMYFGNIMIAVGICLIHGSPWMFAIVLPFFIFIYLSIVAEEERFLAAEFGDRYDEYRRRVNRFWPSPGGLWATLKQHRFEFRRVVSKEYGTFCALSIGIYGLILWKYGRLDGFNSLTGHPILLVAPPLVILALYCTARFLKKTRRLKRKRE